MESEPVILPQDPPPLAVRAIAGLLISLAAMALLAAVLVKIPETIRCPFVLVSENGVDPIQSPLLAVVHRVEVEDGEEIQEGDTLFVLRSDEIRNWQTQLQIAREDSRALRERIVKLEEAYESQFTLKTSEIAQMDRERQFQSRHTATAKDFLARMEKLAADGLISEVERMTHELNLAESEKNLQVAENKLEQARVQRQQMGTDRTRQRADEQAELEKLSIRIKSLERQLENCEGDLMRVRAPYDAGVIAMAQRNAGNVVQPGQQLCQLARLNETARARLLLHESGLSRVAAHQRVRLFFEAFPYQRCGAVTGTMEWISPAAVSSADTQQFVALASLDQNMFLLGGQSRRLTVGMKGEARVMVGHRALVEYAFEPIRRLRENLRQ